MVTDCSVPKADPVQAMNVPSSSYDKDFFADDLFIGDSISTGYSLYGFFPEKNVFAKVGLNPSTVLTKTVSTCFGDIGVADMVAYTMPKRAYIMLGSNGIQWLNPDNMVKSTEKLVNLIHETSADTEVVIISVPPVTPEYASTVSEVNVVDIINRYNAALSKFCEENGLLYVNGFSVLKNSEGYFDYAYAEADGMHFKASAYKTLLSKIQSDVEEFEAAEEEESPAETEPEVTEAETSAVAEDIDSKLWEDASKMSDAAKERLLGGKD
ncbi:MAG: GDSL-type esterase/lipase family protein [Huintestinicola sp.]